MTVMGSIGVDQDRSIALVSPIELASPPHPMAKYQTSRMQTCSFNDWPSPPKLAETIDKRTLLAL